MAIGSEERSEGLLLQAINLGESTLKNRIGFGPINPGFAHVGSAELETVMDFYASFLRGELGLLYLGGVAVSNEGRSNSASMVMGNSNTQQLLGSMIDASRQYKTKIVVQIMHAGRQASSAETGSSLIAASPIPCEYYRGNPREASRADIRRVVEDFRISAKVAANIGCELIEIHAAHGYLISGFLSRSSNVRCDEYGGSVKNRFRILHEIFDAIRNGVSASVGLRINAYESDRYGLRLDELIDGLGDFIDLVDFISISAGMYTVNEDLIIPRRRLGPALWRSQASTVRKALETPVLLAGNIDSVDLAASIVSSGDADVVLMVRSLLADPYLLSKWLSGNSPAVQPCTELLLCKYHSRGANHIYCPHNPVLRSSLLPKVQREVTSGRESAAAES